MTSDATTKKFVADLLKTKAGTTYVNNELAKKANREALKDYIRKSDLPNAFNKRSASIISVKTIHHCLGRRTAEI